MHAYLSFALYSSRIMTFHETDNLNKQILFNKYNCNVVRNMSSTLIVYRPTHFTRYSGHLVFCVLDTVTIYHTKYSFRSSDILSSTIHLKPLPTTSQSQGK